MANNPFNLFKRKTTLPYGMEPVEPQQTVQTTTQAPVQPTTLYKPNDPTNLEHLGEKRAAEPTQPKQSKLDEKWGRILGGLQKPQQTTGETQPVSEDTAGMDYINSMYTSPKQEEKYRKASVNRQRILALGDALRHIGNIYHTVKYAPSQQFNNPVGEEYQRYVQDKAIRDANNQKVYSYQQQKAAQDAKMKQEERRFEAEQKWKEKEYGFKERDAQRKDNIALAQISRYAAQNAKDEATRVYNETKARLLEEGWPLEVAIKQARAAQIRSQESLNNLRLANGGSLPRTGGGGGGGRRGGGSSGGKYFYYDENGDIHYVQNQTMYGQGVYGAAENAGIPIYTTQEYTDGSGVKQVRQVKVPQSQLGGQLANMAKGKGRQGTGLGASLRSAAAKAKQRGGTKPKTNQGGGGSKSNYNNTKKLGL